MPKARPLRADNFKSPSMVMLADMRQAVQQASEFLRSIGSAHRLMILCLLTDGAKTVTQLCEGIGARQSLVSQHLTRLRLDGLVQANRQGHFVHYSLTETPAKDIVGILHSHFCPDRPGIAKN
jgi:DNA-binding transcriptional ArsR family regulator